MGERPIIMQAESVRAILAGTKTQTRRVVKPQPVDVLPPIRVEEFDPVRVDRSGEEYAGEPIFGAYSACGEWGARCPYGAPSDRLWVKEAWSPCDYDTTFTPRFRADGVAPFGGKWKSPLFLPRSLSRLTLEVQAVRVERLHEIQEDDARAEGVTYPACEEFDPVTYRFDAAGRLDRNGTRTLTFGPARCAFERGWDALNAKRGFPWANNPWVWVVTFKRVGA